MSRITEERKTGIMVCIDLDGTLLNSQSRISDRNQRALKKCLDEGAAVYFVTGRPYCFTKSLAETVDTRIGVISAAGACYEWKGELIVNPIPHESLKKFVDCLEASTAHAFFKGLHSFYTHDAYDKRFLYDGMNDWFSPGCQVRSHVNLPYAALREQAKEIHKILVYEEERSQLDIFEEQVSEIPGIQVSRYNDISFDVTAAGVDKGHAIRDICKRLGIAREVVLAIGDAPNDMPMLKEAGIRVAMGNAKEEIRSFCERMTASNEEDGVAQVLEHLYEYLSL